jgi:class 3 adenylate cyclase|tara:strand:- start:28 stop:852 length:825 start_codon:yes stop_codon:yes gene_type:complete
MELVETKLAIVLLDLIGSTKFVQQVGALKAAQWLQYHDRLARSLVYKFEGREIDRSDGFLLSFDRPIDAVNFALIYQQTVPPKVKIDCRIGIHWGCIVEVKQSELFTMTGAKSIELEGVSKNIAARTMSICQAGQVLLTKEAMAAIKGRTNHWTPRGTRYACVGEYRFKGVREPQIIYAVGSTIESLQPPPSSEKVKRLGGPKKIKSRMRDRKVREWLWWFLKKVALVILLWLISVFAPIIINPRARLINGLDQWFYWVDPILITLQATLEKLP